MLGDILGEIDGLIEGEALGLELGEKEGEVEPNIQLTLFKESTELTATISLVELESLTST
jgi:hypothetical protein